MNKVVEKGNVSLANKIARAIWNVVYFLLFMPFGTKFFLPWRLLLLKMFGAKVYWDSGVYSSVRIWAPWNLQLGHNAWLGPHVICYNQAMVTLKKDAVVSQYAYLCTAGHKTDDQLSAESGLIVAPITIGENAWIGTRAYVNMGVEIGEGAIVGATASVFKDVEPWTIVGGNPATIIKKREFKNKEI